MRCIGLLPKLSELPSEITCGALEQPLTSQLPNEFDSTATDLLRAIVNTVLYGMIRSAHPGIDDGQLWAIIPTACDNDRRWTCD